MMQKSPAPDGSTVRGRRSGFPRYAWFGAALSLFAVSSFVAFRQQPRMDAFARPSPLSMDWWTKPVERNAPRRLPLVWGNLNDVFALRSTGKVWAVGEGGLVLHSDDYGRHWRRQYLVPPPAAAKPASAAWLRELSSADPLAVVSLLAMVPSKQPPAGKQNDRASRPRSVALTAAAALLAALPNQPPQQAQQAAPAPAPPTLAEAARSTLWSVQFVDASNGWVAGDGGALFSTADGGESWQRRDAALPLRMDLRIVSFTDRENGSLVGRRSGELLETRDGGRTWSATQGLPPGYSENKVRWRVAHLVVKANRGSPEGWDRLLQVTSSMPFQNATRRAVDCDLVGNRGWALEAEGTLNRTLDGTLWSSSRIATPVTLSAIRFADPRHGWVAGGSGTLLATEDGGDTWFRQSRPVPPLRGDPAADAAAVASEAARYGEHSLWPAPLYYLSLLFVGLLLVPALKAPPAEVDPRPSVASLLVSDRPIEKGEADVFDFNAVALGLSRFLRNEKTEPPLTIAVTGEWGSGKSSLMNLLRADLERYGFRPVWFNAWHHQKEDNLLASLLEAIRAQAIPPVWRPEGMIYRGRLLRIRWARFWPIVALLLLAFSVSAGYIRSDPRRIDQAQALVDSWVGKAGALFDALAGKQPAKTGAPAPGGQHVPVAGLLLSALGLAVSVWKGMKGFGVDPASLLARDSGRIKDLQALTGFRQRFAAEFQDVTRALNPRTMLILIDDLDRCRPENVIEVLESVNFLVSSGDCFVVMGMARERVVRCVGLSFKDVADELLDQVTAPAVPAEPTEEKPPAALPSPADAARQRRLDFAQQYLEKLINIEVPVPAPTGEQSQKLLAASEPQDETPAARRQRQRQEIWTWTRRLAPLAGFVLLLAAGFYYGLSRPPEPAALVVPPAVSQPAVLAAGSGGQSAAPAPARQLPQPSMGDPVRWHLWPLAVLAVILVGLGIWRLSIPPDVVIHDSREFEQALATWHPLLFSFRNTPRSIKRYLNRVRYLAMLQRPPAPEPALWRRIADRSARFWRRITKRPAGETGSAAPPSERPVIPEDLLVALSAIDCCRPEWLRSKDPLPRFLVQSGAALPDGIKRLSKDDGWLNALNSFCPRYLEMASGIHVS